MFLLVVILVWAGWIAYTGVVPLWVVICVAMLDGFFIIALMFIRPRLIRPRQHADSAPSELPSSGVTSSDTESEVVA